MQVLTGRLLSTGKFLFTLSFYYIRNFESFWERTSGSKVLFFALTDIGVNLTDAMYQGEYHGSKKHEPDLDAVLERAWKHGLDKMMITGGSLDDAHETLEIARSHGIIY